MARGKRGGSADGTFPITVETLYSPTTYIDAGTRGILQSDMEKLDAHMGNEFISERGEIYLFSISLIPAD